MRAAPYDVPDWLPPVLLALAKHVNDPQPVGGSVKRTFGEFWRTHQVRTVHHPVRAPVSIIGTAD